MAITVIIRDEVARSVCISALWKCAAHTVDEDFSYGLDQLADEAVELSRPCGDAQEAVRRLAMLRDTETAVDRIRAAALGETVEMPVGRDALATGLDSIVYVVQEDPLLLNRPKAERARRLSLHDTAIRLFGELPAKAVA